MPRLSEIEFRRLMGWIPYSRLTKKQKKFVDDNEVEPVRVEYYFGRRCAYYATHKFKM